MLNIVCVLIVLNDDCLQKLMLRQARGIVFYQGFLFFPACTLHQRRYDNINVLNYGSIAESMCAAKMLTLHFQHIYCMLD